MRVPIRLPAPRGRNKYFAVRTDGYDSKKESVRAFELKQLEKAGEIIQLDYHRRFELLPADALGPAVMYEADFTYYLARDKTFVVEDVKSPRTRTNRTYRLKRRLLFAVHGLVITEV